MQPQLLSGARALLSISGSPYAAGYVLDYSLGTAFDSVRGVDIPLKLELVPSVIDVSLMLRIFRSPDNDPVQQGIAPPADTSGSTFVDRRYTEFRYLTVHLRDRVTDQTILYIPEAVIVRRSGSLHAEDLLSETITVEGTGFTSIGNAGGLIPSVTSLF